MDWPKVNIDTESTFMENIPFFALLGILVILMVPSIPASIKMPLVWGGMILSFVLLVLTDKVAQWEASKYFALELIVRPQQKRLRLFIKENTEDIHSTLLDPNRMMYKTTLECVPIIWEPYGKISEVELIHELPWEKRIVGVGGKVIFKGLSGIQHNKLAILTVWEPKEVKGRLDSRRLEFVPEFF